MKNSRPLFRFLSVGLTDSLTLDVVAHMDRVVDQPVVSHSVSQSVSQSGSTSKVHPSTSVSNDRYQNGAGIAFLFHRPTIGRAGVRLDLGAPTFSTLIETGIGPTSGSA